jgi:hypothetical protein
MGQTELVTLLVNTINGRITIPFVDQAYQHQVTVFLVTNAVEYIPESLQVLLLDSADGISLEEAARWVELLTHIANRHVDFLHGRLPASIERNV